MILFTGVIHLGLTHTCANDEVPGLQKDWDVSLPQRAENRKSAVPGAEYIGRVPPIQEDSIQKKDRQLYSIWWTKVKNMEIMKKDTLT